MPYALILIGVVLIVAGVRNTERALFNLMKGDFTGQQSFIWWAISIAVIGAIGYINDDFRKLSHWFLALILIVLVLAQNKSGNDVFTAFTNAIKGGIPNAPVAANNNAASSTATSHYSSLAVGG